MAWDEKSTDDAARKMSDYEAELAAEAELEALTALMVSRGVIVRG